MFNATVFIFVQVAFIPDLHDLKHDLILPLLHRLQRPPGFNQPCAALAVWLGSEMPAGIVYLFSPQEPFQFDSDIVELFPDCSFRHGVFPFLVRHDHRNSSKE